MLYVATRTFTGPDGDLIEAGRTFCHSSADVVRMFPDRFRQAPNYRAGFIDRSRPAGSKAPAPWFLTPSRETWTLS
jgi:hypothetical protein